MCSILKVLYEGKSEKEIKNMYKKKNHHNFSEIGIINESSFIKFDPIHSEEHKHDNLFYFLNNNINNSKNINPLNFPKLEMKKNLIEEKKNNLLKFDSIMNTFIEEKQKWKQDKRFINQYPEIQFEVF